MIHPPTFYEGPLHDHETCELADLLELVGEHLDQTGEKDLAGHLAWWIMRLSKTKEEGR
jgi:hypothetical protein